MMSKVAFEAYQKGEIKLQDFVGIRRSKVWGETRYERSWREIEKRCQAGTLAFVPKNTSPTIFKAKGKARGWFFQDVETFPVALRGVLHGQMRDDSCVAACARMIAADAKIETPEAYLRDLLKIEAGGYLSDLPATLQALGIKARYEYRRDLTLAALQESLPAGDAIAYLENSEGSGHAVVIEAITDEFVTLRDPLPKGEGRGYQVRHKDFLRSWLHLDSARGRAVIVVK